MGDVNQEQLQTSGGTDTTDWSTLPYVTENGVHEYIVQDGPNGLETPVRMSGYVHRKELFRRRCFAAFSSHNATLTIYKKIPDSTGDRPVKTMVVTSVQSLSNGRLAIEGYSRELYKEHSDTLCTPARSVELPGNDQRFYLPETEVWEFTDRQMMDQWLHFFHLHFRLHPPPADTPRRQSESTLQKKRSFWDKLSSRVSPSDGKKVSQPRLSLPTASEWEKRPAWMLHERGALERRRRASLGQSDDWSDCSTPLTQSHTRSSTSSMSSTTGRNRLEVYRLDASQLQRLQVIKRHSSSCHHKEVWQGSYKRRRVLIQSLHFHRHSSLDDRKVLFHRFVHEIMLVSELRHPSIVSFIGVSYTHSIKELELVTEYCDRGDLSSFVEYQRLSDPSTPFPVRWVDCCSFALNIADALVYLHSHGKYPTIQNKLYPQNIYLQARGTDLAAKIGSFSMACKRPERNQLSLRNIDKRWVAPEVIANTMTCSTKSDIYSFGILLCYLSTWKLPYEEHVRKHGGMFETDLLTHIVEDHWRPVVGNDQIAPLVKACLAHDPEDRPDAVQVRAELQHVENQ